MANCDQPLLSDRLMDQVRRFEFRGKYRLLSRCVPVSGMRLANVYGAQMKLDLSDHIQRLIYMGAMGASEVGAVKKLLRAGQTFVDVGANVGFFTALASRRVGPQGRVIAFEPSSYAYGRLTALIAENRLFNVEAVKAAVSDQSGENVLYVPEASAGNHSPTMVPMPNGIEEAIQTVTVDDQLKQLHVENVDLLKIDVEGHEPKVLAGASDYLQRRRIRAVLCEFNEYWLREAGSSPDELWEQLMTAGFISADGGGRKPRSHGMCFETRLFVRR